MTEARLERITHGLAPTTDGWFVLNAADAQWIGHPSFGEQCVFEASGPVTRQRADLERRAFPQVGINIAVLEPGTPKGLYHREARQEGFLVLEGECILLVEGEERRLRQWDYFHCPAGTEHVLIGAEERAVVLAVGSRAGEPGLFYPRVPLAVERGAAAEEETSSGADAYAPYGHWQPAEKPAGLP